MAPAAPRRVAALLLAVATVAAAACSGSSRRPHASAPAVPDPPRSVVASPDYDQACAPSGLDSSDTCVEVTLQAIDNARAAEGVKAMALPSDFARLPVPEQVFAVVAVDDDRSALLEHFQHAILLLADLREPEADGWMRKAVIAHEPMVRRPSDEICVHFVLLSLGDVLTRGSSRRRAVS